jgi:hypothetical protein
MNDPKMESGRTASPNDRSPSESASGMAAKSHEVAGQLKDAVVDQANQVRDRAQSAKEHTADRIRRVATQLESMGDTLREEDPFIAKVTARASSSIEGVAKYVDSASAQSFIRDTEQLARRQPLLFFGGAFLAGLAAGRFLKSSRPEGSSYDRAPGAQTVGEGSAPRMQERPSSYFPSRNEGALAGTESTASRYNAAFGRDLPDTEARAGSSATTRNAGTGPTGSPPLPSTPLPSTPPPRMRDKNGGGAGKGTLP